MRSCPAKGPIFFVEPRPAQSPCALARPPVRVLSGVLSLLLMGLVACATPEPEPKLDPDPLPVSAAQARDVVVEVQARLVELAKAGTSMGFEERRSAVMELGRDYFALPLMAQLSYGKGWPDLTPDQQRLFVDTFTLFRCSSVAKLNSRDRGQVYRFTGYEEIGDDRMLIRTGLRYPNRALEIVVDYQLIRRGDRWKIVDRYAPPSVSEVAMRRAEYHTLLEKEGFDGLIQDMERRIQDYPTQ